MISINRLSEIFSKNTLNKIFPPDRTDLFFEALLGDASEGAYDLRLLFQGADKNVLHFAFELQERPGHCLVCSLTYGLPHVFSKHPIINVDGIVNQIKEKIGENIKVTSWSLERTIQQTKNIHIIPLTITLDQPIGT
ncbi:hypothetical protein MHK_002848 [Candidatus Magnetomorum sp. HK-1]|nr:hypothetical protein MHK_002848 [Candidatus Magnetomorum sp. HK-1]